MMSAPFTNPFRPGAGHPPPYLAGREEEKLKFTRLMGQQPILTNLVLTGLRGVSWQQHREWAHHIWWQFVVVIDEKFAEDRDAVLEKLQQGGVDARRLYYPMHQLPIYEDNAGSGEYPVADHLAARGICLPTWSGLKREDVHYVCEQLKKCADL